MWNVIMKIKVAFKHIVVNNLYPASAATAAVLLIFFFKKINPHYMSEHRWDVLNDPLSAAQSMWG